LQSFSQSIHFLSALSFSFALYEKKIDVRFALKVFREKYQPRIAVRFSLKDTKLDKDLLNIALYHSYLLEHLINV
jgi:hypothetical protein